MLHRRKASSEQQAFERLLACDFADHVLPYLVPFLKDENDDRAKRAVEISRRFALGKASVEELREAEEMANDVLLNGVRSHGRVIAPVVSEAVRGRAKQTSKLAQQAAAIFARSEEAAAEPGWGSVNQIRGAGELAALAEAEWQQAHTNSIVQELSGPPEFG